MKKYLVFTVSFFLLYLILQIGSGFVLTALYSPSPSIGNQLSQKIVFGEVSYYPVIIAFLAAIISFFLVQKVRLLSK